MPVPPQIPPTPHYFNVRALAFIVSFKIEINVDTYKGPLKAHVGIVNL